MAATSVRKYAATGAGLQAVLLLAASAAAAQAVAPADTLFTGGAVYTMDAARRWACAVAVRGGRVVYVGDDAGARAFAGPRTRHVELDGRMLLPGFADSHVHPVAGGVELLQCDLNELETEAALLAKVRACAAAKAPGEWIVGGGWQLPTFAQGNPHRRLLDEAAPGHPVALAAADGHSLWVSSKALELAGVTRATPDPPNGRIERDAAGEPTGTLRESASGLVRSHAPSPTPADRLAGLKLAVERAHRFGITSWFEASARAEELEAYRELDRAGGLGLHVRVSLRVDPRRGPEQVAGLVALRERGRAPDVVPAAAKLYADGVIEAGTAALLEPYLNRDSGGGEPIWSAERMRAIVSALDAAGFQLHVHAIGDRAIRITLDAIDALAVERGARDRRPLLAHLELIDPTDIPRFRRLGVAAGFQPLWAFADAYIRELTVPFLGSERSRWLYPIGSVARSGAVLAAGSDWSVSSMNPLEAIEVAITRRDPTAGPGEAWIPDERTDLATLLAAYTIGGAWAAFREEESGSIEVGKSADFVVLEKNLFEIAPNEISEVQVSRTWFRGREVYRGAAE